VWRAVLTLRALVLVASAATIAFTGNSADLPWFFPLIALPLASLVY